MNYDQLQAFIAVAKSKSFSKAALKLYLSQPALSKKISSLEKDLDCLLFERSRNGVKLTEHGRLLFAEAQGLEEKLTGIRFRLKHLHQSRAGHIRLSCSETVGAYYLPLWLGEYMKENPEILITAKTSVTSLIVEAILSEEIDFGFFLAPESDPRIESFSLFEYEDVLIFPEGHPFAQRKQISLEEILKEKLLLPGTHTMTRKRIENALHKKGLSLQEAQEAGSVSVLKEFVRIGLGVGICPNYALDPAEKKRSLPLEPLGGGFKRTIALGWRKDRYFTPAEKSFLNWIRKM